MHERTQEGTRAQERVKAEAKERGEEEHQEAGCHLKIKQDAPWSGLSLEAEEAISLETSHGKGRGLGRFSQKITFPSSFPRGSDICDGLKDKAGVTETHSLRSQTTGLQPTPLCPDRSPET